MRLILGTDSAGTHLLQALAMKTPRAAVIEKVMAADREIAILAGTVDQELRSR